MSEHVDLGIEGMLFPHDPRDRSEEEFLRGLQAAVNAQLGGKMRIVEIGLLPGELGYRVHARDPDMAVTYHFDLTTEHLLRLGDALPADRDFANAVRDHLCEVLLKVRADALAKRGAQQTPTVTLN